MIIKSNFKDYYDYMANIYGGGDPSIQYIRRRIAERTETGIEQTLDVPQLGLRRLPINNYQTEYSLKWLSIAGCYYLLVSYTNYGYPVKWSVLSEHEHPKICKTITKKNWITDELGTDVQSYIGKYSKTLVELSRKINAPVFTFVVNRNLDMAIVDGDIPILKDLGMTEIMKPDQLYQDLSYFMGNIIKESPDVSPVSISTDKEKIAQHGFDFKQSFRHRV